MRALLALTGLTLTLGACTSAGVPTPTPSPETILAAPEPIAGRDWHLSQHDGESSLAFGVAETDDVDLGLHCEDGSGRVHLFRDVPDSAPTEFRLDVGGEPDRITAESEPSAISDGQMLSADASVDLPVFQRFRNQGWIALWHADERHPLPSHPGARADIERFFSACA